MIICKAPEPSAYAAAACGMTPASMVAFRVDRWISSAMRGTRLSHTDGDTTQVEGTHQHRLRCESVHTRVVNTTYIQHIRPAQTIGRLTPKAFIASKKLFEALSLIAEEGKKSLGHCLLPDESEMVNSLLPLSVSLACARTDRAKRLCQ